MMDTFLPQTCLTCLCKSNKFHSLQEILLENLNVWEALSKLVPLLMEHHEFDMPQWICAECLDKLVVAYTFQKQCLDAVQNLYKLWTEKVENMEKENPHNRMEQEQQKNELFSEEEDGNMANLELAIKGFMSSANKRELTMQHEEDPIESRNLVEDMKADQNSIQQSISSNDHKTSNETQLSSESNQCKICHKQFKQHKGLALHMAITHLKEHLYKCNKCDKGFISEEAFMKHYNRHLGIKSYQCDQCDKAFDTNSILNQHLLTHSNEANLSCTICGKRFRRSESLKKHIAIAEHENDKSHDLESTKSSEEHLADNSHDKPYKCSNCSKSFKLNSELKKHSRRMHKNEKVKPQKLGNQGDLFEEEIPIKENEHPSDEEDTLLTIDGKEKLIEEMPIKTEIPNETSGVGAYDKKPKLEPPCNTVDSNACDLCTQIFKTPQGLAMHRSKTHFKKHLYKCDQCSKGFDMEDHYIKHRNRHLGIKTFKCNQCDKAFDANSVLNQHLISHSKEAPYLCTICGKSFRRIDGLRQHSKRHSDEKPFQCSVCPKSFKCRSDHIRHMMTHSTEKRYECDICGSRLATSESLMHHKRVHSGVKPFKCSFCDKCFNSVSNMKCHERIHTGEKPYKCPYCPNTFRQSNDRNKHAKRVHKDEYSKLKAELTEGNEEQND